MSVARGGPSAVEVQQDRRPASLRVYIVAQKTLVRNTRIFKQARSLVRSGYEVVVIGIRPKGAAEREIKDGYTIVRLQLDPLHVRAVASVRRELRRIEVALIRIPVSTSRKLRKARLRLGAFARRVLRRAGPPIRRLRVRLISPLRRARRPLRRLRARLISPLRRARRPLRRLRARLISPLRRARRPLRRLRARLIAPLRPASLTVKRVRWRVTAPLGRALRRARHFAAPSAEAYAAEDVSASGPPLSGPHASPLVARYGDGAAPVMYRGSLAAAKRAAGVTAAVRGGLIWALRRVLAPFSFPLRSRDFDRRVEAFVIAQLPPPDIVHATDLDALVVGRRLARRYGVPLVYDNQELYTGVHTLSRWYRLWLTVSETFLIRAADRVIAVNDAIADVIAKRYRRPVDAVVLNCAPYEELPPRDGAASIRAVFGLPADVPVFLYSGGLGKQRGIENTVLALRHLSRGVLVILGEGGLKAALVELIEREGLTDRVMFSDFVPHDDVPSFIASADVGVIPYENVGLNHYLCSPSKLFHYIMAGLPIACSDFPFLRQVVGRDRLGTLFDPADPASIAAAMEGLVSDPAGYAACRARVAAARERYCWEVEEQRFLGVYRSLAVEPIR